MTQVSKHGLFIDPNALLETDSNEEILKAEATLDAFLQGPGPFVRSTMPYWQAVQIWTSAVVARARSLGPVVPDTNGMEQWLNTVTPLLIVGEPRAGTSLLRNLLDGHPQITALPGEGLYITHLRPKYRTLPGDSYIWALAGEWAFKAVNVAEIPTCWLLGRSDAAQSPYVEFVRRIVGSSQLIANHADNGRDSIWPGAAWAWRQVSGGTAPLPKYWLDRSPGLQSRLGDADRILRNWKTVQVLRSPDAAVRSLMQAHRDYGQYRMPWLRTVVRQRRAFLDAAEWQERAPARFRTVRYEQLVAAPDETMAELLAFLEIDPSPAVSRPTVSGRDVSPNTSFPVQPGRTNKLREHEETLPLALRLLLAVVVDPVARPFVAGP